jgi:hypothetical protein
LRKLLLIFLLVFGAGVSADVYAQSGGRKKEGGGGAKKIRFSFKKKKSQGHADEFAKGNNGRRGRISRLFKKDRPAWVYKSSGSVRSHNRENRFLFKWSRSQGRAENAATTDHQNKVRERKRSRGNSTFKSKKYKKRKSAK